MKSIFVKMESKTRKQNLNLLPGYFKKIGLALILLAIGFGIVVKLMHFELFPMQKELFRTLMLSGINLGLLLITLSKDKLEDEMTIAIRLKAMAWSFTWAVFYVIISPFMNILFKDPMRDLAGQQVIMSMLFVYMIMYFLQKKSR
jgi:hypothetical protein